MAWPYTLSSLWSADTAITDDRIAGRLDKRVAKMNEEKTPPAKRSRFFSTAIVLIWTITMLAVALFLMSTVVVRLGV